MTHYMKTETAIYLNDIVTHLQDLSCFIICHITKLNVAYQVYVAGSKQVSDTYLM